MTITSRKYIGGFLSQDHSQEEIALKISGNLPEWLHGTFFRNGPALFELPKGSVQHFFDGLAMLHRFYFKGGQVLYASKFLQSEAYKSATKSGKFCFDEFGTHQQKSLIQKAVGLFSQELSDNANVNIAPIAGSLVAMTETPSQLKFDGRTLATLGKMIYTDNLFGQLTTAHPHYDFERRELINLLINVSATCHYQIYALRDGDMQRRLIASLPVKNPGYVHSFAITKRYIVIAEFPLLLDPMSLALSDKAYIQNYHWYGERASHYLVIDRDKGELVGSFPYKAAFAFHQINAFEIGDEIVLDASIYDDSSIIRAFYFAEIKKTNHKFPRSRWERIRVNVPKKTVTSETLLDSVFEFPRLNYKRSNGNEYNHAFGVGQEGPESEYDYLNALVKCDTRSGATKTWASAGAYPGEPVFVGKPAAKDDDEGVVLSLVSNPSAGNSYLLLLDAMTFQEIARADLPAPVSFGLHGSFIEEREN
jgi:carotenoid cleavage dioxygenase-like enzyme